MRRSSSWRSLKERGNNYLEHFTSRTLSVDELHRNQKTNSLRKQQCNRRDRMFIFFIFYILKKQKNS